MYLRTKNLQDFFKIIFMKVFLKIPKQDLNVTLSFFLTPYNAVLIIFFFYNLYIFFFKQRLAGQLRSYVENKNCIFIKNFMNNLFLAKCRYDLKTRVKI